MKIVHVSYSDMIGGASRAAYRLHCGLLQNQICSRMLVQNKQSLDKEIYEVNTSNIDDEKNNIILNSIQTLINQQRTPISNTLFSLSYPGVDIVNHPLVKKADIINFHWIARLQSPITIANLLKLDKPIVWTLHDMNPFTGGCHFSVGCEKYIQNCQECPQLESQVFSVPQTILDDKIKAFQDHQLTIVSPSKWLAKCAKQSNLFKNQRIEIIPNSVEIDLFYPINKTQAKQSLKINPETNVILLGAYSAKEIRKGFEYLFKALAILSEKKIPLVVLCFGEIDEKLQSLAIQIIWLGVIDLDQKLREIYSAADLFILPSLEDNLPNTMLESMACGTPVIGFDIGGIPDLVTNHFTGRLVPPYDIQLLANTIIDCLSRPDYLTQMGQNSRQLIEIKYSLNVQANRYLEMYQDLLKLSNPKPDLKLTENDRCFINTQIGQSFRAIYLNFAVDVLYENLTFERKQHRQIIEGIERSIFWKIRSYWFNLKKYLNLHKE